MASGLVENVQLIDFPPSLKTSACGMRFKSIDSEYVKNCCTQQDKYLSYCLPHFVSLHVGILQLLLTISDFLSIMFSRFGVF